MCVCVRGWGRRASAAVFMCDTVALAIGCACHLRAPRGARCMSNVAWLALRVDRLCWRRRVTLCLASTCVAHALFPHLAACTPHQAKLEAKAEELRAEGAARRAAAAGK